ncbi:hypothetical protein [Nocardia cyriacigeorgica]|uniref:hypothetical protein n=1 Tax=Nocardia cyriacigeorgica TaxID=135487 RepID=UPI00245580C0|nr:hypothetical protein [Nocardia cyriacigeorgica]
MTTPSLTGDSETFELMSRFYGVGSGVLNKQWQLEDPEARRHRAHRHAVSCYS